SSAPANAVMHVTTDAGQELNPSLSPDGTAIVFAKLTAPGNSDIYVIKAGGAPVNLTADSKSNDIQPEFSPDGQSIAFRSARDGGGIFVMSAAGGDAKKIVDEGFNPTWSPDGKTILYDIGSAAASPYGATSVAVIWSVNVATGEKKQISK